ncbi:Peptidoglycan glycosyltransferase [Thermodesulfobium narugense DSM 14796]|uniref:Peptidoglycan glycosyltransferase n=1 Tax=Thermodesulfobium narugense DSM 14796 TaxID=747365 RepID=M1E863_9BACT|nr:penicillin-binding protein 2 [Thermodesulfobium narugense]AEE14294.1 Peptidoglycan glycosyltransferase [Thermodesulfobium narugense DSM 14796]
MIVLFFVAVFKQLYFVTIDRQKLISYAQEQRNERVKVSNPRGEIIDREGVVLAFSIPSYSLYIQPSLIKNDEIRNKLYEELSKIKGMPIENLKKIFDKNAPFTWVYRKMPFDIEKQVREVLSRFPDEGIGLIKEEKRVYPYKDLAEPLLGFVGIDNQGLEGIEKFYNSYLGSISKEENLEFDANGRIVNIDKLESLVQSSPVKLKLTINSKLQGLTERLLDECMKKYNAKRGTVVVVDVKTGSILTLAQSPRIDPDKFYDFPEEDYRIISRDFLYEPGSILKPIIFNILLDNNIISKNTTVNIGKYLQVANRRIFDAEDGMGLSGPSTIKDILRYSSNIGAGSLALKAPNKEYFELLNKYFCDDEKYLFSENFLKGYIHLPDYKGPVEQATTAFGQGISLSFLNVVAYYSAIANGGEIVPLKIIDDDVSRPQRLFDKGNADFIRKCLVSVVQDGTGVNAKINGVEVAGKTGTAQKPSKLGGYIPGEYVASFIGFFPANDPKYVIGVLIDNPVGIHWGGSVAAPLFREIAIATMSMSMNR